MSCSAMLEVFSCQCFNQRDEAEVEVLTGPCLTEPYMTSEVVEKGEEGERPSVMDQWEIVGILMDSTLSTDITGVSAPETFIQTATGPGGGSDTPKNNGSGLPATKSTCTLDGLTREPSMFGARSNTTHDMENAKSDSARKSRNQSRIRLTLTNLPNDVRHELTTQSKRGNLTPSQGIQRTIIDSFRAVASKFSTRVSPTTIEEEKPNFAGKWRCISTWGLEDFLKSSKVGRIQRMAALSAPWPSWYFEQPAPDLIFFTNTTAFGTLQEDILVGGPEYTTQDTRKQDIKSQSYWQKSHLIIDRCGPQGDFREDRWIDDAGKLQFRLAQMVNRVETIAWGRTFQREN